MLKRDDKVNVERISAPKMIKGDKVSNLPSVSEVREFTITSATDTSGNFILCIMINGKWYQISILTEI